MKPLPRILIIDDLFGRTLERQRNMDRAKLCAQYELVDITGDETDKPNDDSGPPIAERPIAEAFFFRGQSPLCAGVGDIVENDVQACVDVVRRGWFGGTGNQKKTWALALLDLSFETGRVTEASSKNCEGKPEGCDADTDPEKYFGLRLLQELKGRFPDLPVIIFSSMPREEVARAYLEKGGHTFLERGQKHSPQKLADYIDRYGLFPDDTGRIVGRSKALLVALRDARVLASVDLPVLLRGESGTGKELFANYIRYNSKRTSQPMVPMNMAAIPRELAESELFGHVKGSFTGAVADKKGRIEQADKGTLFLDEIAEASLDIQAKLLRFFTESAVWPVGSSQMVSVDARIIAATDQNIEERAKNGAFKPQLLERIRGATISLPPLREIKQDIPSLVGHFIREGEILAGIRTDKGELVEGAIQRTVSQEAMEKLIAYDWPNNVRQLRNVVVQAVVAHRDAEWLLPHHFSAIPITTPQREQTEARKEISIPRLDGNESDNKAATVSDLLSQLREISFPTEVERRSEWVGRFSEMQSACAGLFAKQLKAALETTRKPTPDCPNGEILIHPAIKILTGNKSLSASEAADLVKRILNFSPMDRATLLADATLQEAHAIALRLRPRKGRKIEPKSGA